MEVKDFLEIELNQINEIEQAKLLNLFAKSPMSGKKEICRLHQKIFAERRQTPSGIRFLRTDSAGYDYVTLLSAIKLYRQRLQADDDSADALIAEIKTERRINRLQRKKNNTVQARLKAIHGEIKDLRGRELSWAQIAKYLYQRHRKYLGGRTLSADYIRRTYLKVEAERNG